MCSSKPKPPPPPPPIQPPVAPPVAPEVRVGAETGGSTKRKKVSRTDLRSPVGSGSKTGLGA